MEFIQIKFNIPFLFVEIAGTNNFDQNRVFNGVAPVA
jgi:hypothetical protein